MTKIKPPLTPRTPQSPNTPQTPETSQTETAAAPAATQKAARTRGKAAAFTAATTKDTRDEAPAALSPELTQALSLIPPNLSRIKTHVPLKPLARFDPGVISMRTELGGQAERVADGTQGLVDEPAEPHTPQSGPWHSPATHLDAAPGFVDADQTMLLLARIDHHLDVWQSLLGLDHDI